MVFDRNTVFVLGAGFTRAFVQSAPLMVADYGGIEVLESFKGQEFERARRILELELEEHKGQVDIERLMTRLDGGMPYDAQRGGDVGIAALRRAMWRQFRNRIMAATGSSTPDADALHKFAAHCVRNSIDCLTFNYDDLLDRALADPTVRYSDHRWNADRGYAFPCLDAEACVLEGLQYQGPTSMALYKLHGSINWRIPLGTGEPFALGSIRHKEDWTPSRATDKAVWSTLVESVLEQEPLMVPPVLTKAALMGQPVLRHLWSRAFDTLKAAKQVVFIGYSLPVTDIAAAFLFREGLNHLPDYKSIFVIDFAPDEVQKDAKVESLVSSYVKVFRGFNAGQVSCEGAVQWIRQNLTGQTV